MAPMVLWSPAHPAIIDKDGAVFHRVWCPEINDGGKHTGTFIGPSQGLMWSDRPRSCPVCRSETLGQLPDR